MKLGLGLYRASLTEENFKFARQAGATHLVVHLVDYFRGVSPSLAGGADLDAGWGFTANHDRLWTEDELLAIKAAINAHGLDWEAIENLDPAHWYDVLLDGPGRRQQLEEPQDDHSAMGRVGIPILGYNFSIAGVWGWTKGPFGRGGAALGGFRRRGDRRPETDPRRHGLEHDLRSGGAAGPRAADQSNDEIWQRLADFLEALVPVAEENGVRLAAHPDDPPVDTLRGRPGW